MCETDSHGWLGMRMQLKGCVRFFHDKLDHGAGGATDGDFGDAQTVWWTMLECAAAWSWMLTNYVFAMIYWALFLVVQVAGLSAVAMVVTLLLGGPLVWRNYQFLHGFMMRSASWRMGFRHRWFIMPSLWTAWWLLKCEITYLHDRFRAAGQGGDMMVDIEGVFQSLDECLTGGATNIGAAEHLAGGGGVPMMAEEPMEEPFGPDEDIADVAFRHEAGLNGYAVDQMVNEGQAAEERQRELEAGNNNTTTTMMMVMMMMVMIVMMVMMMMIMRMMRMMMMMLMMIWTWLRVQGQGVNATCTAP